MAGRVRLCVGQAQAARLREGHLALAHQREGVGAHRLHGVQAPITDRAAARGPKELLPRPGPEGLARAHQLRPRVRQALPLIDRLFN